MISFKGINFFRFKAIHIIPGFPGCPGREPWVKNQIMHVPSGK
jgi:hypothetical protein